MRTRRKRINYRLLNGGSDDEASPEDRMIESDSIPSLPSQTEPTDVEEVLTNISDAEIVPSESASQSHLLKESSTATGNSVISYDVFPQIRRPNHQRPAPATEWLWAYFDTTAVDREWVVKKTNKRKLMDRDIRCTYVDDKTGMQCGWKTIDSSRQTLTSNMKNHLAKHSIYPPSGTGTSKTSFTARHTHRAFERHSQDISHKTGCTSNDLPMSWTAPCKLRYKVLYVSHHLTPGLAASWMFQIPGTSRKLHKLV